LGFFFILFAPWIENELKQFPPSEENKVFKPSAAHLTTELS